MPGVMRRIAAGALMVAVTAAAGACGGEPAGPPEGVQSLEAVDLQGIQSPTGGYYTGTTVTWRVRALDHAGEPMPGQAVRFLPLVGTGLSAAEATTDAAGVAEVDMIARAPSFGARAEANDGVAWLEVSPQPAAPPEVRFEVDEVRLESAGEQVNLFAQVLDARAELIGGESVGFTLTTPGIVRLADPGSYTGTTRSMRVGVVAEAPGETMLVATHRSAAADTAYIEVVF